MAAKCALESGRRRGHQGMYGAPRRLDGLCKANRSESDDRAPRRHHYFCHSMPYTADAPFSPAAPRGARRRRLPPPPVRRTRHRASLPRVPSQGARLQREGGGRRAAATAAVGRGAAPHAHLRWKARSQPCGRCCCCCGGLPRPLGALLLPPSSMPQRMLSAAGIGPVPHAPHFSEAQCTQYHSSSGTAARPTQLTCAPRGHPSHWTSSPPSRHS